MGAAVTHGAVLAGALMVVFAHGAWAAQESVQPRPRLPAQADTNDWEAYYDYGASVLRRRPDRADQAFYWASRLDASRAEPLFGRWVAFWLRTGGDWGGYLRGEAKVRESPRVREAEVFRLRALRRNPLGPQTLEVLAYDELIRGEWRRDPVTRGFLAYAAGRFDDASSLYARGIARDPERYYWVRYYRALALVAARRFDSALAEIAQLVERERRRAETRTQYEYESLEFYEHATGLLYAARGDLRRAREAFGRALLENLGFYPARAMLGYLALAADDATAQFRAAIDLEPYFADPYYELGAVLDAAGLAPEAAAAYAEFLARAPRRAESLIARARARIESLAR